MSETTTVAEGQCIGCQKPRIMQGKVIGRHVVATEQPGAEPFSDGWVCLGSGHLPASDDEVTNTTRWYALQRCAIATRGAEKLRTEMISALGEKDRWLAASVINHYAMHLVLAEELAHLWGKLGDATDSLMVVKDALAALAPPRSGSPQERATADAMAAAARQFLTEVRRELERAYPDGWTADQVATVLFSL